MTDVYIKAYQERVYQLTVNVAKEAMKMKAKLFIEMSTGQVYGADKVSIPWIDMTKERIKWKRQDQTMDIDWQVQVASWRRIKNDWVRL